MSITLVGDETASDAVGATTFTIPISASAAPGDVVYVFVAPNTASDQHIQELNALDNWRPLIETFSPGSRPRNFAVFRRIMGATPDVSVTFEMSPPLSALWVGIASTYRSDDNSTPEDVPPEEDTGGGGSQIDPPSIDPVTDDCMAVVFAGGSSGVDSATAPSGYGNFQLVTVSSGGTAVSVCKADKLLSGNAPEDPGSFGVTGALGSYTAGVLVIRPAIHKLWLWRQ